MKKLLSLVLPLAGLFLSPAIFAAEDGMRGTDMPMPPPKLAPAEGASVKIVSPKDGQVVKGGAVPLEFKLTKGKRGNHVHAYVDGELMGMFMSETGTLTGIQPGKHTLELRVVVADHTTELDASDKVAFVVK
jgi:hypothetical protein